MEIVPIQVLISVTYFDIWFWGPECFRVLFILDLLSKSNLEDWNLAIHYCFYLKLWCLLFLLCLLYFFGKIEKRIYDSNSECTLSYYLSCRLSTWFHQCGICWQTHFYHLGMQIPVQSSIKENPRWWLIKCGPEIKLTNSFELKKSSLNPKSHWNCDLFSNHANE